jgi:hypothetical protein
VSDLLPTRFNPTETRTAKFARKLLGESEIEAILQRLDRLTDEEARMTATHTLEVVYGLVNNLKGVMDGMRTLLCWLLKERLDWFE